MNLWSWLKKSTPTPLDRRKPSSQLAARSAYKATDDALSIAVRNLECAIQDRKEKKCR